MSDFCTTSNLDSGFSTSSADAVTSGFIDENVCGESKSCIVYKLYRDGLRVAVKRLRNECKTDPQCVNAIRKEFLIGQQLRHNAIPVYHDISIDFEEVYLVMDYVDGDTLEDYIRTPEGKEYFSSKENVHRFLRDLLNAVGYLHRNGVIHSDLKPANIMIRRSDGNVMLLDLDKAYSDTLDNTHGGTSEFSDVLNDGQLPTANKDFRAIGRIIDEIASTVAAFPSRQFKHFREKCSDKKITYFKLASSLDVKPIIKPITLAAIAIVVVMLIGVAIGVPLLKNNTTGSTATIRDQDQPETPADSTLQIATPAISASSSIKTEESKSTKFDIDIDTQMADFTSKVESATRELSSGITQSRLNEILYDLTRAHSSAYRGIIEDAKRRYPDTDVEIAIARAYERSRAGKLYIRFNKAVSDTLRNWDTPMVSDDNL